jgi:hypothetical protein
MKKIKIENLQSNRQKWVDLLINSDEYKKVAPYIDKMAKHYKKDGFVLDVEIRTAKDFGSYETNPVLGFILRNKESKKDILMSASLFAYSTEKGNDQYPSPYSFDEIDNLNPTELMNYIGKLKVIQFEALWDGVEYEGFDDEFINYVKSL